jgi:hypothetical protein
MINRQLKFAEAIHEAIDICLDRDRSTYLMGLGVPDPIGVFGTTKGLQEKHGKKRVFDMPVAENAMTGVALGSCLVGMRCDDRDGSNLQPGRQVALYVRRPVQGAVDDPNAHWPGLGAGAAAFAEPACVVCAYSGLEGGHAVDALRRQRTADRQHRG